MTDMLIKNTRIMDPKTAYDTIGDILIQEGKIIDFGPDIAAPNTIKTLDGTGLISAPGLIDMRVTTGEPGRENRETLATAAQAAIAGGVTGFVITPNTNPVIDDISLVDFLIRRSAELPVNIYIGAALTKGLDGHSLTEIGLMHEAGAVLFSNGPNPIENTQIMRRIMDYSTSFKALIANRAVTPDLSKNCAAHESDFSARLGLIGAPAISETIMIERDIALAGLTGARLLVDLLSSAQSVIHMRRAKAENNQLACSVSINHLALNEIDIGDYRSFAKLDPPLREEHDRQALLSGVNDGTIDVIVSDHDPRPAGEKRLPFSEASNGAVGLEILLAAGLSQVADGALDLMAFLAAVTCNPAQLLGLNSGQIAKGAPADLVLFDPMRPWICDSEQLKSRSKNTPFDGRRMTGKALYTIKDGEVVFSG